MESIESGVVQGSAPEAEVQQGRIDSENAERVFAPKFIPWYPELEDAGLTKTEALLYGFIDFYTSTGAGSFYFTDEQLSTVLRCSIKTVKRSMSKLNKLGYLKISHKVKAGGGIIRFVKLDSRRAQNVPLGRVQNVTLGRVQNVTGNKNKIKDNKINKLSKDKGETPPYGNLSVNRFIEGVNENLDFKLPDDGQARRYARNAIQLLTRSSSGGTPKQGREFLKEDPFENAQWFMTDYLNAKIERGFHPQKWGTLYDNLRLWIANEGRFPEDNLSKQSNVNNNRYGQYYKR